MNTLAYIGARLKEASSWAGTVTILLAAMHLNANPGVVSAALSLLAAAGGLIAVLVPEGAVAPPPAS